MGPSAAPKPTLQSAWNLFATHWRTYLALQLTVLGLAVVSAAIGLLITVIAVAVTGGVSADLPEGVTQLVSSALNLPFSILYQVLAGLIGVLLSALPALWFATGHHLNYRESLALLRANPRRYVLAGLLVSVAASIGILLCVFPGLIVMALTPIYVRRVFTSEEPLWPAFWACFNDLSSGPSAIGLIGYQLIIIPLILISALFCLVPLLVTVPLAAIFIQQYLAAWEIGAPLPSLEEITPELL
ncbi:hypothetical protein KQ304_03950 [Synechococcus sp. CS-1329]|jgi:hypothetical protein|uniref:hypothetical protein n=1 Tax=Synechococcus sp. CS-1329 TaxID=2847975 RepID=UPI00223BBA4B|nr:hypothetical protein [Synechococcus sp. CS-1329]MCT0218158.1 hypothetical protein [Synechococcus sp. CS-1329]